MRLAASIGLLMSLTSAAAAQQRDSLPPIDTDRPDFTDGVHTVPHGHIQVETGYTYQQGRGADPGHSHSVPEALVRFGLGRRIELRLGENYLVERGDGANAASVHGFDDTYLGTKVSATEQQGLVPALSFELKANLPTGTDAISAHRVLPGAALLLGWETAGPWSAGIEVFGTRTAADHAQAVGSLSVQFQAATRAQLYGEVFTLQPVNAGLGARAGHYANSGILLLLSNDMQVDARFGLGLNHNADRYFVGFGFAVRR
jgi:hypothetical protein